MGEKDGVTISPCKLQGPNEHARGADVFSFWLWGEAGAPGGTVRRAAVRKRGPGSTSLY